MVKLVQCFLKSAQGGAILNVFNIIQSAKYLILTYLKLS